MIGFGWVGMESNSWVERRRRFRRNISTHSSKNYFFQLLVAFKGLALPRYSNDIRNCLWNVKCVSILRLGSSWKKEEVEWKILKFYRIHFSIKIRKFRSSWLRQKRRSWWQCLKDMPPCHVSDTNHLKFPALRVYFSCPIMKVEKYTRAK